MQEDVLRLWQSFLELNDVLERRLYDPESYFGLIVGLLLGIPMALVLSRKHPREFYLIWYIFSLMLFLFFALHLTAGLAGRDLTDFMGQFAFVYVWMTNDKDEMLLVGATLYLEIGPQLLTYLICGPFGAASRPIFVRQIQAVAILSIVKFCAGMGGIMIAEALTALALGKSQAFGSAFRTGFLMTSASFAYAVLHFYGVRKLYRDTSRFMRRSFDGSFYWLRKLAKRFFPSLPARPIVDFNPFRHHPSHLKKMRPFLYSAPQVIHRVFTRHVPAPEPEPLGSNDIRVD